MSKPIEPTSGAEVDAAIRTLIEASQGGHAGAHRVATAAQARLSDATTASRQFVHAWSLGLEATLKASFEAQNAVLATAPPLLDSLFGAQRKVFAAWTAVVEQQQATILETLRLPIEPTETSV